MLEAGSTRAIASESLTTSFNSDSSTRHSHRSGNPEPFPCANIVIAKKVRHVGGQAFPTGPSVRALASESLIASFKRHFSRNPELTSTRNSVLQPLLKLSPIKMRLPCRVHPGWRRAPIPVSPGNRVPLALVGGKNVGSTRDFKTGVMPELGREPNRPGITESGSPNPNRSL